MLESMLFSSLSAIVSVFMYEHSTYDYFSLIGLSDKAGNAFWAPIK